MDALVITHAADMDGIGSGALIMRRYGVGSDRIIFTDYGKDEFLRVEKLVKLKFRKGGTLFITDLNAEGDVKETLERIVAHVKSNSGKLFWFDHHKWSEENLKEFGKQCERLVVGGPNGACASEVTAVELGMTGDPFVREFLRIVHISDFNLAPDSPATKGIIGDYVLGISYFRMSGKEFFQKRIAELAEALSKGEILPAFLHEASVEFSIMNEKRLKKMEKTIIKGGVVSVGFSPIVSTGNACDRIREKTGSDIGCYVNTDADRVHFRSVINDTSILANRFGGGGHAKASGFELKKGEYNWDSEDDRKRFAKRVMDEALNLYGSSEHVKKPGNKRPDSGRKSRSAT